MRTRTLLLLAALATVVPVSAAGVAEGGGSPGPVGEVPAANGRPSSQTRALIVLRRWDRRRAAAWATGDPAALTRLYVRGSRTGSRDVHDLRRWLRRGLRVTGLHQQVASSELAQRAPHRIVVLVTDRTVDGIAVAAHRRTAVPASAWAIHRIALGWVRGSWRVVEAWAQPAR